MATPQVHGPGGRRSADTVSRVSGTLTTEAVEAATVRSNEISAELRRDPSAFRVLTGERTTGALHVGPLLRVAAQPGGPRSAPGRRPAGCRGVHSRAALMAERPLRTATGARAPRSRSRRGIQVADPIVIVSASTHAIFSSSP